HQVRDTRLRCAVASPQGPRPDLARPDAACDELAPLWRVPEDRPHDLAFGLRPARLFAAPPPPHTAPVAAMAVVSPAPPLLVLFAEGLPRWLGLCAWLVMALTFQP